jgi:hypothetical protein
MPNISIEIDVSTGAFQYRRKFVHLKQGDTIDWTCNQGPFAIQFVGRTQPGQTVRQNAQADLYRYAVAVYANDKVYLDAECPAIIMD